MHPILEQVKCVMHHAEAFEQETLRRFRLKPAGHRGEAGVGEEVMFISPVDVENSTFGSRTVVTHGEAWFEVYYEDDAADDEAERAFALTLIYRPAAREYSLEVEIRPEGEAEAAAVLGPGCAVKDGKRLITADQYALIAAGMAKRYAERRRDPKA